MTKIPAGSLLFFFLSVAASLTCGADDTQARSYPASPRESAQEPSTEIFATLELEATYPEGFSFLNGIRELPDGTVLAADPLAQVLLRIDLDASTADTLGRVGPGPQEYEQPDQVFPLPGDSSLLVDLGKAQLTAIHPDGTFGEGMPMTIAREDGFPAILHPRFVDASGDLYHQASRSRGGGPPDSAAVTRYHRASRTFDTVATVWVPENSLVRTQRFGFLPRMLEPRDDWAVGADGRVAVVRAEDFSVEWTFPGGERVNGPPHDFQVMEVGREDKEAIMAEMRNSGISATTVASRSGDVQRMSMSRGLPNSGDGPGLDDFEWAEAFPAFRNDRTLISPAGEAWVERWVPVESDSRWEIFDGKGVWLGSVTLPGRRQLIGFGRRADGSISAYAVKADEYEIKWLERYRVVR